MTEEDIARHESGHACAAVLLGISVTAARIERTPDGRPWGFISYPDLLAEIDKKRVRDIAVMTMCGPIMEGRDLPSWPPSRDAYHQDERHMACYADYLGLDEAGWYGLRAEAYRLTATDEFCHLWEATTGLLERCVQLDEQGLRLAGEIARKVWGSMRTWIAKRKAVQTKRKALQTYGGACAHCIVSKAVTVLPRHHPSLRDDMRDPNSWLPVCRRCESVVKHERKQLIPGGYGV